MMQGVPPAGSGYSAEPEPSCTVSAVPVSIPNAACIARASWEMVPEALDAIRKCGGFVQRMEAEAVAYRIEFTHPSFDGREMLICFTRVVEKGYFTACLKDIRPIASAIEARRAETGNTDSVHESAVAKPDAQGAS